MLGTLQTPQSLRVFLRLVLLPYTGLREGVTDCLSQEQDVPPDLWPILAFVQNVWDLLFQPQSKEQPLP